MRPRFIAWPLRSNLQNDGSIDPLPPRGTKGTGSNRGIRLEGISATSPGTAYLLPVTNEEYATQIARDWNVRQSGAGFVTRFQISAEFASRYPVQKVGGAMHTELSIPADELAEFNQNIVWSD
jgi:hypothetical protein